MSSAIPGTCPAAAGTQRIGFKNLKKGRKKLEILQERSLKDWFWSHKVILVRSRQRIPIFEGFFFEGQFFEGQFVIFEIMKTFKFKNAVSKMGWINESVRRETFAESVAR